LGFFAGLLALLYLRGWMFALSDLRLLYVAGIAGAWGASFSMLSGLKNRIEESEIYDLHTMRAATMVLARALVGAGAASVLYLFFFSGLLSGAAFPSFTEGDPCGALRCVRTKDIALLVVWCFIVGFSEKLIPGLLDKTGSKLSGEADRYRPTEPARGMAAASSTGPSPLAAGAGKSGGSAAGNGVAAV
jgi:hypothetical protein